LLVEGCKFDLLKQSAEDNVIIKENLLSSYLQQDIAKKEITSSIRLINSLVKPLKKPIAFFSKLK
jgi:hypothetical protein